MPCTTILVGKDASYDGSTIIARNEDSANGEFNPKRFVVVKPEEQPRHYRAVISHLELDLPDEQLGTPLQYTAVPNAVLDQGIWGEAGVNAENVAMSETETITSNERVLGADPLVELVPAVGQPGQPGYRPEVPGGIGEEDFLTLVLPYVHSAREGVLRLGALLEEYGTYEMNGVAFSDVDEIWWLETVGGHHWIAKRVPDEAYVTMPNQLGIDEFDLDDAFDGQEDHLCSADLREFIADNHLDLGVDGGQAPLNPRLAFGSHSDTDHVYNTPRAWFIQRFFNPYDEDWDTVEALHNPESDDIPWARQPEHKITVEDIKYALSSHYQGTPYDPYGHKGTPQTRAMYRPIGINRQSQLALIQLRPYRPAACQAVQWLAFGSNPFNTLVPFYTNVDSTPAYLENTTARVSTDSFYWANRLIAALADAHFADSQAHLRRYQEKTGAYGQAGLIAADQAVAELLGQAGSRKKLSAKDQAQVKGLLEQANQALADRLRADTDDVLDKVLFTSSMAMRNGFFLSDN